MNKNDFIFKMKILNHTARCYFEFTSGPKEDMLRQGLRIRAEIIEAQKANPELWKDPEVREFYEGCSHLEAFRSVAMAEERRLAEEANDREIKRMEEERKAHKAKLDAQLGEYEKAIRDFDESDD